MGNCLKEQGSQTPTLALLTCEHTRIKRNWEAFADCRPSVTDHQGEKQMEVHPEGWHHEPEREGLRFPEGNRGRRVVRTERL